MAGRCDEGPRTDRSARGPRVSPFPRPRALGAQPQTETQTQAEHLAQQYQFGLPETRSAEPGAYGFRTSDDDLPAEGHHGSTIPPPRMRTRPVMPHPEGLSYDVKRLGDGRRRGTGATAR
ncbi:protein of unknown function [Streptomyces murinus]